jgi:hypothetical protein
MMMMTMMMKMVCETGGTGMTAQVPHGWLKG